jgi:hypothetical protein
MGGAEASVTANKGKDERNGRNGKKQSSQWKGWLMGRVFISTCKSERLYA